MGLFPFFPYLAPVTQRCYMKENTMKHKRWTYLVVAVFLTLMACSLNICGYRQGYERQQLSDTHWIAQEGDTYTFARREGSVLPDSATLRFSRFFGKETLWTVEVERQGYLHIAYSIISGQGPFEVVLVQKATDQVIRVAKLGTAEKRFYLEKGTYLVKILGYDASGSVTMALSYPQGISSKVSTMRF